MHSSRPRLPKHKVSLTLMPFFLLSQATSEEPLFIHLHGGKGALLPTLYCIWMHPTVVPTWVTPSNVWKPLYGGADLMLPGVLGTPSDLGDFKTGDVRSVTLVGNPAPVAVGVTLVSAAEAMEREMKGKGLRVVHIYSDHLYQLGSQSTPNEGFLRRKVVPIQQQAAGDAKGDNTQGDNTQGDDVKDSGQAPATDPAVLGPDSNGVDLPAVEAPDDAVDGKNAPQEAATPAVQLTEEQLAQRRAETDEILHDLFFRAIVEIKALPLPASDFFSEHMLKCLEDGEPKPELKKSSYKRLASLMKAMEKDEVVALKQRKDGAIITGINRGHETVEEYALRAEHRRITGQDKKSGRKSAASKRKGPANDVGVRLLYKPSPALAKLFTGMGWSAQAKLLAVTDARKYLWTYVKENGLDTGGSDVNLDEKLFDTLNFKKGRKGGLKVLTKGRNDRVSKRELAGKLSSALSVYHAICEHGIPDPEPEDFKRGAPPAITISHGSRGGKKMDTFVENLQAWGIKPKNVATLLRKKKACSTTVRNTTLKGKEVQVVIAGGDVRSDVHEYLIREYGIPSQYVVISKTQTKVIRKKGGRKGGARGRAYNQQV